MHVHMVPEIRSDPKPNPADSGFCSRVLLNSQQNRWYAVEIGRIQELGLSDSAEFRWE
jgi:hypothetical protein